MQAATIARSIATGLTAGAAIGAVAAVVSRAAGDAAATSLGAAAGTGAAVGTVLALGCSAARERLLARVRDALAEDGADARVVGVEGAVDALLARLAHERQATQAVRRGLEIDSRVARSELDRLRRAVGHAPEGLVVLDGADEVVLTSTAGAARLGIPDGDEGKGPLPPGGETDIVLRAVREARAEGPAGERRLELPEGGRANIEREITVRPLHDAEGRPDGSVLLVRDLSHERELGRMTSEFVAKASHELRTPLSSITAYAEMLVDGEAQDDAARRECYEVIEGEASRLGRLIDDMLDISRIEAGLTRVERTSVDLGDLMRRTVESIQPQAHEKEQHLQARVAEVDLRVEGDRDMLQRVIVNLLSNAVKYTPEGGRIVASVDSDNLTGSIVLAVEDTGMGIPPDRLEKVFEKFYRIENYERMARGTGLGLNLCRHIVESLHAGQIGVESELGRGSKFWISVPMRHAGGRAAA